MVPWFAPIAAVIGSRWADKQPLAAVASASALAEGGWWPQERLAEAGLAADPFCRACPSDDRPSVIGSLWHRTSCCAGTKDTVAEKCPGGLRKVAQENPLDPLFADGIPLTFAMLEAPGQQEHWVGSIPADGAGAQGQAYTDGALRGSIPRANRAS